MVVGRLISVFVAPFLARQTIWKVQLKAFWSFPLKKLSVNKNKTGICHNSTYLFESKYPTYNY